ncbi:MAG TPA: VWA domain-containing protein [Pyrinomonadaceae bacterium]|nr:VWA domain-containing protein [Pyrinomonadaceae bacterium]
MLICFIAAYMSAAGLAEVRAQESETEDVISVSTDLLLFPIRIRDKRGQVVVGLKETDLSLEDKDKVTTGLYFAPGADRVALVFALDQSGSLREIISQQRDAALALFRQFGSRSTIGVLRFTDVPTVVAKFDGDMANAAAAFSFYAGPNQRTAIFDAAARAVRMFEELPRVRSERRIVILISDGLDNASRTKAGAIIDAALTNRISFYVIHLPLFEPRDGRLAVRRPASGFRDLAEKTGGKYFLVGDASAALAPRQQVDLTKIFEAIEDDLKSQYLLGFYLGENANDGRKHRFALSLPSGMEYQVGRLGYSRKHQFFVDRPRQALKRFD